MKVPWPRSMPWDAIPPSPSRSSTPRPTTWWPVKDNQPTLHADIKSYFETAPSDEVAQVETVGKDHSRIEVRAHTVSHVVDWITAERCYPGAPRFKRAAWDPKYLMEILGELRVNLDLLPCDRLQRGDQARQYGIVPDLWATRCRCNGLLIGR